LFAAGCLALYVAALTFFAHYSCQNSQPTRHVAVEEVRDVEAR
jgi:hypothetical protein